MRILAQRADRPRADISLAKRVEDMIEGGVSPERVCRRFHLTRGELKDLYPHLDDDEPGERNEIGGY